MDELSMALDNLQVYCNTLHEEVHVLYSLLHPDVATDPVAMGAGPQEQQVKDFVGNWTFLSPLLL